MRNCWNSIRNCRYSDKYRRKKLRVWHYVVGVSTILIVLALAFSSKHLGKSVSMNPCDLFGGNVCAGFQATVRPFTDDELAIRVLAKEMLSERTAVTDWNPKVAFMFLIASDLPFERVWEKFFQVRLVHCTLCFHTWTQLVADDMGACFQFLTTSTLLLEKLLSSRILAVVPGIASWINQFKESLQNALPQPSCVCRSVAWNLVNTQAPFSLSLSFDESLSHHIHMLGSSCFHLFLMRGQGNEGFYSIYVHASNRDSSKVWNSTIFAGREIPSKEVMHLSTVKFQLSQQCLNIWLLCFQMRLLLKRGPLNIWDYPTPLEIPVDTTML